jgi:ABC-type branched-subunit amino acid transport system substrate-binding protein
MVIAACGSSSKSATTTTTAATATTVASSTTSAPSSSTSTGSSTALSGGSAQISGPGVTATTITLGQIATVSGPVPGLFQKSVDSMDAFVAYINSQGGIDGRKLVVIHKDDGYDCDTYTNDIKSLSTEVFALVGTFSVEDECGAPTLKANPNLADIEADIINPELFSAPNAFAGITQPPGFITTGYQWIKDKFPNDITAVGSLYPTSAAFSEAEEHGAAQSVGYKYVYTRGLGLTETNFTSDILRMKADNVKIVDLLPDPVNIVATFEQEAAQQGFHPDAVLGATAYDGNFFKLLGSNSAAADNLYAPLYFPLFLGQDRATNPALDTYLTWLDKTHPGDSADLFGETSWTAGVLFATAVQDAGKSGPVTQASVVQTITNLGSFTADGLNPATNPGKRIGPSCEVIVGVKDGQFVRIAPATGYECNGTYLNIPLSKLG